jgi:hypothetical protein
LEDSAGLVEKRISVSSMYLVPVFFQVVATIMNQQNDGEGSEIYDQAVGVDLHIIPQEAIVRIVRERKKEILNKKEKKTKAVQQTKLGSLPEYG